MAALTDIFARNDAALERLKTVRITHLHYSKLNRSIYQYRDFKPGQVAVLADLIESDGAVLQPLLVRKDGNDTYEIISGHKRHEACRMLVEERGLERFAMLPCAIIELSDVRAQFSVYSTNGYGPKTPYEMMTELEGMRTLLTEHPDEFPEAGAGRMRDRIARLTGLSASVVTEYRAISTRLSHTAMGMFRDGTLPKSSAVLLSRLPVDEQDRLLESGMTAYSDIAGHMRDAAPKGNGPQKSANINIDDVLERLFADMEENASGIFAALTDAFKSTRPSAGRDFARILDGLEYEFGGVRIRFGKPSEGITISSGPEEDGGILPPGLHVPGISYRYAAETFDSIYAASIPMIAAMDEDALKAKVKEGGKTWEPAYGFCPICGSPLMLMFNEKYCGGCGNLIDWDYESMRALPKGADSAPE